MKKFDLKKFLAENKATFHSSLSEDKGLTPLQQFIYDYESEVSGEETANEELENFKTLNTPDDVYEYYASEFGEEIIYFFIFLRVMATIIFLRLSLLSPSFCI